MFNSIEYVNDLSVTDKNGQQTYIYQYVIYNYYCDRRVESWLVKLRMPTPRISANITRAAAIITACQENRRSVSKMLSEWFIKCGIPLVVINDLSKHMSNHFPELHYNEKYAKCTLKRIEMLMAKR
jgi:hypothetical protein